MKVVTGMLSVAFILFGLIAVAMSVKDGNGRWVRDGIELIVLGVLIGAISAILGLLGEINQSLRYRK